MEEQAPLEQRVPQVYKVVMDSLVQLVGMEGLGELELLV